MKAGLKKLKKLRMLRGLLEAAERKGPVEPAELVKAGVLEPGVPRGALEPVKPVEPAELAWIGSMMPACLLSKDSVVCFTGSNHRILRTRRSRSAIVVTF